jgi:8-oxo-dGTP pyrophosphatase MutT (NUDIX family)
VTTPPKARVRASVVCEAEGRLLVVRLRDPVSGVEAYFPPGGAIEPGESPMEAARRETLEETGLRVRIDEGASLVKTYPFCWAGIDYEVTTHFFAASLEEAFIEWLPKVVDASYNLGAAWLPAEDALRAMAIYPVVSSAVAEVRRLGPHAK